MERFAEIPVIDNHLHPPLPVAEAAARPFASFFTEANDPILVERFVPQTRFFRRALTDLAALLGCNATAEDVTAARAVLGLDELLRRFTSAGNVGGLIVDGGYPPEQSGLEIDAMGEVAGCRSGAVLRLELLVQELVGHSHSLEQLTEALLNELDSCLREQHVVAVKSIIAYRCGLAFYQPLLGASEAGFRREYERSQRGPLRVSEPDLLYYILALALVWCGDKGLPLHLHTGFGDRDLDLVGSNPALLKPLLEDSRLNRGPIVLLHAGYPYCREAGYLAAMYPNVYVDWSLANPLLVGPELVGVLRQLLALAPYTKLLYGSDAWGIPDWIYLGALYGRRALAEALADEADADAIARRILHDNAAELHGWR